MTFGVGRSSEPPRRPLASPDPKVAPTLGGVESLATTTRDGSHANSPWRRSARARRHPPAARSGSRWVSRTWTISSPTRARPRRDGGATTPAPWQSRVTESVTIVLPALDEAEVIGRVVARSAAVAPTRSSSSTTARRTAPAISRRRQARASSSSRAAASVRPAGQVPSAARGDDRLLPRRRRIVRARRRPARPRAGRCGFARPQPRLAHDWPGGAMRRDHRSSTARSAPRCRWLGPRGRRTSARSAQSAARRCSHSASAIAASAGRSR